MKFILLVAAARTLGLSPSVTRRSHAHVQTLTPGFDRRAFGASALAGVVAAGAAGPSRALVTGSAPPKKSKGGGESRPKCRSIDEVRAERAGGEVLSILTA